MAYQVPTKAFLQPSPDTIMNLGFLEVIFGKHICIYTDSNYQFW